MKIIKNCSIDNPFSPFSPSTMLVYEDGEIFLGRFSMSMFEDMKSNFNIDLKITDRKYMTNLTTEQVEKKYAYKMGYRNEPEPIQEVLDIINIAIALQRENKSVLDE
jgi:hypothetical protein